jgi:hypothetical protein
LLLKQRINIFGILIKLFLLSDSAGGHLAGLVYAIIKQPELCKVYNVQPPEIMIREFCYMVEMI